MRCIEGRLAKLSYCCPVEFGNGREIGTILSVSLLEDVDESSVENTVGGAVKSPCELTASRPRNILPVPRDPLRLNRRSRYGKVRNIFLNKPISFRNNEKF